MSTICDVCYRPIRTYGNRYDIIHRSCLKKVMKEYKEMKQAYLTKVYGREIKKYDPSEYRLTDEDIKYAYKRHGN